MRTPVVYVGGASRSGSTLLERMLAQTPGCFAVGELVFIWERGLRRNDRCGCGDRFRDCEFWREVGDVAFGGWEQVDVGEAVRLRRAVDRHRNLDRLYGLRPRGRLADDLDAYARLTGRLYGAVQEVSGASIIVDSSKHATYAMLLQDLPDVDLRLIHLVRRIHGVAYSWSKRVHKPDVGDGTTWMSLHSAPWAVSLWIAENLTYELLRRKVRLGTRLRYEDLVAHPGIELARIGRELQLPDADRTLRSLCDACAVPLPNHALSGNPMRFESGPIVVRSDEEWRTAMPRFRRAAISAATWPLLKHYGYVLGSGPQVKEGAV